MKRLIKQLFFLLAPKRRLPSDRAVILMYHSVGGDRDYFSSVSPAIFERQMAYLAKRGIPVVPLAELIRRLEAGEPLGGAAAITFDDGYRDNYDIAYPVLKRFSLPATIFAATGLIGGKDGRGLTRLAESELREMQSSGLIDIEPHTRSHPRLSSCSEEAARAEISDSKRTLEGLLGKECRIFAYPFGDYSEETVRLAREAGFRAAVTVREGSVRADSPLMELPRASIDRSTSFAQFRGKLSPAADWYERMKSLA